MRKKITIGFMSLVVLLLFAGIISIFELNRLRSNTADIIEQGAANAEIADKLITALRLQNTAVIKMIISDDAEPGEEYAVGTASFDAAIAEALAKARNKEDIAPISGRSDVYRETVDGYANESLRPDMEWFASSYLKAYYELNQSIINFVSSPQTSLAARAEALETSAYKTTAPSILTLLIAILLVLIFFFFIDLYYIRPLRKINKGLNKYLMARVPFDDSFAAYDDLEELKKNVAELIEQSKRKQ